MQRGLSTRLLLPVNTSYLLELNTDESSCDDVFREFNEFCESAALQAKFREFDTKLRVNTLMYEATRDKSIIFMSLEYGKDSAGLVSWTGQCREGFP